MSSDANCSRSAADQSGHGCAEYGAPKAVNSG
jgi:hypothetical protein